jgi:hypothetical protein
LTIVPLARPATFCWPPASVAVSAVPPDATVSNPIPPLSVAPFHPIQALPKSAEFPHDLRAQFGNLGLAAAAHNAGPQRVHHWLAGRRTLPLETQTYVRSVMGRSVQEWARSLQEFLTLTVPQDISCAEAVTAVARLNPQPQT